MKRLKRLLKNLIWFFFIGPFFGNPLFVGGSFSLLAVYLIFYVFPLLVPALQSDIEYIKNFIEWFGVPYGLFIALVLVNLWTQHDTVDREFDGEADAVSALQHTALMVKENPPPIYPKSIILSKIDDYVIHIKQHYLTEYKKESVKFRTEGDTYVEEIREAVGVLVHTNEEESIKAELLDLTNQLRDIRGDRLAHARQRMHSTVWVLSVVSSFLWLLPFYGLAFENSYVAIILQGGVTFVVVAILAVIRDLNNPFTGTWKVDLSSWEELETRLAHRVEKVKKRKN